MCSGEMRRDMEGTPVAKATFWSVTDADVRKRGDQTGFRYPGSPRRKR